MLSCDALFLGAALMVAGLLGLAPAIGTAGLSRSALLLAWLFIGLGHSNVLTPTGHLLRRSSTPENRPAVFAARFALSHWCWPVCYPLARALMTLGGGAGAALVGLAGLALAGPGMPPGSGPQAIRRFCRTAMTTCRPAIHICARDARMSIPS